MPVLPVWSQLVLRFYDAIQGLRAGSDLLRLQWLGIQFHKVTNAYDLSLA